MPSSTSSATLERLAFKSMWQFRLLSLLLAFGTLLAPEKSYADSNSYIGLNLCNYSHYTKSRVELEFVGNFVNGIARPLIGDSTLPIAITGQNYAPGQIHLEIHASPMCIINLKKHVIGDIISWNEVVYAKERRSPATLYRYADAAFSKASLVMQPRGCGPAFGELYVEAKRGVTRSQIKLFVEKEKYISNTPIFLSSDGVKINATDASQHILGDFLSSMPLEVQSGDEMHWDNRFHVNIGTDVEIVIALRESGGNPPTN